MKLNNVFYENTDRRGFKPQNAIKWRIVIITGLTFSVLLVLFRGISALQGYSETNFSLFGERTTILHIIFFTSVHLAYLNLICTVLIFAVPPEKLYWQRVIIPFTLFLAYFVQFLPAFIQYLGAEPYCKSIYIKVPINLKVFARNWGTTISYFIFLLIYLWWLLRDVSEKKKASNRRKGEIKAWISIEILSIILLIIGLLLHIYSIEYPVKDIVICISLFLWVFLNTFAKDYKRSLYTGIYDDYIKYNKENVISLKMNTGGNIPLIDWGGVSSILDFGCANGVRLKKTMFYLGAKSLKEKLITGYDTDIEWQSIFLREIKTECSCTNFISDKNKLNPSEYQLLFISHILYDFKTTREIIKFIKKVKSGTYIVIRGMSPKSFFAPVSIAYSLRILSPTISYLWNPYNLERVAKKANLKRVNELREIANPDLMIEQVYKINDEEGAAVDKASQLIGILYKEQVGERFKVYLNSLRLMRIESIPNDDIVYVFQKK